MKRISQLKIFLFFGTVLLLVPILVQADMSSSTYRIYADVISIGSGYSEDSTYSINTTGGESLAGQMSSSTYQINGGFQYVDLDSSISLTVSPASVDLGELSTSAVIEGTITTYITTASNAGYTLAITNVSGSTITAVSDGAVSAGSEEYGLALSGTNRAFSNDRSVISQTLASSNTATTDEQLDLTFKASISSATLVGSYTQTITLTATANL